ncbi:PREDICTED: 4-hydroxy-3-methylbut-2-en-1-yl diphosphate synthase (ferredoxin), chloroplastic-like [Prunus mume]|uniref:4-hydroxy-3-methylbut-2-en-1-yl diphosphate synthase (Ferredoxin), chloroplastic-like n=1 Tax=Prunus mume TaxID=102107 RepID=A0ABM0NJS5_PRUMU|nr:PREDICTED: 4-hydroxy-3-methylbut-2-en-1-yl diphosphate synthase (ferredoxin), chloroplastic-like [Prunus mume]
MATGTVPASFMGLKGRDSSIGFAKSMDFVRVCDLKRFKSGRTRISVIRNSNPGSDIAELKPASEGSPLLVPRQKYCESIHKTVRRKTRTVMVGNVAIGSEHPIRIQTMTTTDTKDVAATVEQVMRIADKGADLVRITVQGKKEADACFDIKNTLVQKNYNIPLVADIHFAPSVALRVAECFDKIRVNPGNFADRRAQFEKLEYTEDDYQKELEHIEQVFTPLVEKCKKYGRAMRIGTNHGSLSDRIMSYYGDSPRGMVESAFEFARICQKLDYHNFLFSMKASNPVIMVQAYRLLVAEMYVQGWDYPLHLGVTEAGEGEDGRMKSAIGIGTLLQDGLGDTIRVSLTEAPEEEIDPCRRLANLGKRAADLQQGVAPFEEKHRHYFDFQRRSGQLPMQKEGEEVDYRGVLHRDGSVLMSVSLNQLKTPELLYKSLAAKLVVGMPFKDLATVDSILLRQLPPVDVESRGKRIEGQKKDLRANPPLLQNRAKSSPGGKEAAPARKGQPWQELGPRSPDKACKPYHANPNDHSKYDPAFFPGLIPPEEFLAPSPSALTSLWLTSLGFDGAGEGTVGVSSADGESDGDDCGGAGGEEGCGEFTGAFDGDGGREIGEGEAAAG